MQGYNKRLILYYPLFSKGHTINDTQSVIAHRDGIRATNSILFLRPRCDCRQGNTLKKKIAIDSCV